MSDWTFIPIVSTRGSRAPRILETSYGGGYEQRSGDGLNATLQTWNVEFQDTKANLLTMDSFLKTRAGYQAFTWTPSFPFDTEIHVKCKQWEWTFQGGDIIGLTAVFEEVAL